jgi:hypothetical protein
LLIFPFLTNLMNEMSVKKLIFDKYYIVSHKMLKVKYLLYHLSDFSKFKAFQLSACLFCLTFLQAYSQQTTITATQSGNWNSTGIWNATPARFPVDGDIIVIPAGITVNFNLNNQGDGTQNNWLDNALIIVYGTLHINQSRKLYLGCSSAIEVYSGGCLSGTIANNNNDGQVIFCTANNIIWRANNFPNGQRFGIFSIGNSVLPVELLYFKGEAAQHEIRLSWTTASEINNHYFLLERSSTSEYWNEIARMKGSGTSNLRNTYFYTDNNIDASVVYYRLSQIDFDGTTEIIGNIAVRTSENPNSEILVMPNPASSSEPIEIFLLPVSNGKINILTSDGKIVYQETFNSEQDKIQIQNLKPGLYFIVFDTSEKNLTTKLVVF